MSRGFRFKLLTSFALRWCLTAQSAGVQILLFHLLGVVHIAQPFWCWSIRTVVQGQLLRRAALRVDLHRPGDAVHDRLLFGPAHGQGHGHTAFTAILAYRRRKQVALGGFPSAAPENALVKVALADAVLADDPDATPTPADGAGVGVEARLRRVHAIRPRDQRAD